MSELNAAERATVEALDALAAKDKGKKRGNAPGDSGKRDRMGRIIGRTELTEKQYRFVTELRKGVPQGEAAKRAGYAHSAVAASTLLKSGPVADLIRNGRRRIVSQAASAATQLMAATVLGRAIPSRVQYDAARYMIELDRSMRAEEDGNTNENSNLRGMTLPQLEAMASRVRLPIAPNGPDGDSQVIDNTQTSSPLIGDSGPAEGGEDGGPIE